MAKRQVIELNKGWQFKQANATTDTSFRSVSQFPTNVHLDLLHHGLIPDPFMGKNELQVQWVGEAAWLYRTTFIAPKTPTNSQTELCFDGLDTFATVSLNGKVISQTDNMFTAIRVKVDLDPGENTIEIRFESAYLEGWKLVEQHPNHKWGCWNGDNSRLAVRKAQYHWGWDWGPALNTCGPWRPVRLEIFESRLADLWFDTKIEDNLKAATVVAQAKVVGKYAQAVRFDISLDGKPVATESVNVNSLDKSGTEHTASATFHISNPALWYPIRYGGQPLYTITATIQQDNVKNSAEIDSVTKKIGLRTARLVQKPLIDQPGTSFFFEINNIPIYCGGSDWIPADNFIPRISRQRYYDWVKLAADGNQLMIRVWGGGIYEEQAFYDACDELGVLVWQDFMFGCGNYPAFPEIRKSIDEEARQNIVLLRHHPSIIIWAGNNEDYQYQESENLTYDFANKDAESWLKTDFPARYIYEKILADACNDLIPNTAYHYGSPWGAGVNTHDPTVGDIHQWNVWHGTQEKYQNFDKLIGRFVSEFGMEAFPSIKTIDAFLPGGKTDPDRYPQSATIDFHNKADGHERRIALYLVENFRYAPDPLEQFIYCTQLMQAECLASAYRLWKRAWKGPGREYCGGTLVWQLNDCWPVTSWSIVDYYLRPKLAYYTVKREMADLSVGMTRTEKRTPRNKYTKVDVDVEHTVEIWASNLSVHTLVVDVLVKAWHVESAQEVFNKVLEKGFTLKENRSTELASLLVPAKNPGEEGNTVVATYLLDSKSGQQLGRYVNWPEPLKYLHLQKPQKLVADLDVGGKVVRVSAEVPVKGVALECEDDGVKFEDNLVDIVPGEVVSIKVKGTVETTKITTRYLNMTT